MAPYGRAASARTSGVARLYHELLNAPMKYVSVVVGVARVHCKILNCLWNSFLFGNNLKIVLKFFIKDKKSVFYSL